MLGSLRCYMRNFIIWFSVLRLFWGTYAQACSYAQPLLNLPVEKNARQQLRETLQQQQHDCLMMAGYWANYGALLLAEGEQHAASLALERALLLDPHLMGAKIDYALALAHGGEYPSALQLLSELLQQPDIPAATALQLRQWQQAWQPVVRKGRLGWFIGRDSNLTSAPKDDNLTLTFPNGEATLALADAFRPRAGYVQLFEANLQQTQLLQTGQQLHIYGDLRWRQTAINSANYQQLELGALWLAYHRRGRTWWNVHLQEIVGQGQPWYRSVRAGWTQEFNTEALETEGSLLWSVYFKACRPRVGWEVEKRDYLQTATLNSVFGGINAALHCERTAQENWQLALRLGQDVADDAQRPGGNQVRGDVRLFWRKPLGRGQFQTDLNYSWQQDQRGYSPLLQQNARRWQTRVGARFEYTYPLSVPAWEWVSSWEMNRQFSNLPLFKTETQAIYSGWRYHW